MNPARDSEIVSQPQPDACRPQPLTVAGFRYNRGSV